MGISKNLEISKNPAIFLLAMLKEGGGTAKINGEKLEIGPINLAKKLSPKIREHKQSLIRLLLQIDCPYCGFPVRMQGKARLEAGKWLTVRFCSNPACGKQAENHVQPDFPIYGKDEKEI